MQNLFIIKNIRTNPPAATLGVLMYVDFNGIAIGFSFEEDSLSGAGNS